MATPRPLALLILTLVAASAPPALADESLLTLTSGLVLQGEVRAVEGGWELVDDQGARWLPAAAVRSVAALDEVEDSFRSRRKALRRAPPAERVPLVDWALEAGLYRQALEELDRILEEAPDEPEALALLARPDLPVRVPALDPPGAAGIPSLLDYAARSTASLQELVVARLDGLPLAEQRGLPERLTAELGHRESNRRRFAALALRRLYPGLALEQLTRATLVDPAEPVRLQAALALGDSGDEAVVDPLARLLESESATLRTRAATALGLTGQLAAVEPLALRLSVARPSGGGSPLAPRGFVFVGRQISYVQGYEAEIASSAAIGDPLIGVVQAGATLDAKVLGAGGGGGVSFATETAALRHSLARLTGAEVRDTNAAWKAWWQDAGRDWVASWRRAMDAQPSPQERPSTVPAGR